MSMKRGVLICSFVFSLVLLSFSVYGAVLNVPGNYSTIQAAINNASNGDIINVSAGTYNENVVINNKTNIVIQGNSVSLIPASGIGFVITNSDGITIKNFQINTTGLNAHGIWVGGEPNGYNNSDNIKIENNDINIGGKSTGIYAEQTSSPHSNWEIKENTIDAPNSGVNIELYDVDDVLIDDNVLGLSGSVSVVYSSENADVGNVIISNNRFNGNGNVAGVTPTIWIESDFISGDGNSEVDDVLIQGNEFYNWINAGVKIGEPGGSGTFNDVEDVVINYNSFNSGSGPAVENDVADEIVDGRYNWWGHCTGPGTVASGFGANVSVNVTYTPWLGACIKNKSMTPACILPTDNVTLKANVTGFCVGNVWFGVKIGSGNWNNYTYTSKSGTIYSFILNSNLLVGGQNVSWTVYADDCYNHTSQNGIVSFYVNRRTNLSVNPTNPDGLDNWYVTEPLFTLTNLDANKTWYRWDSTGNILYTAPFNLTNIPNPPPISAGILELTYFSDVCKILGKNESEQSKIFKIDLTNPQFSDLKPLGNVINNKKPKISAYIDEVWGSNSGINKPSVVMKLDGSIVPATVNYVDSLDADVFYNPATDLSAGKHNVSLYAEDKAGRSNQTFWEFNINITPVFSFQVYSPVNKPYNNPYGDKKVVFNISATENLEKIEYIDWNDNIPKWKTLCKDCDEYGEIRVKTKTFNDGWHNVTIRAEDYFEQVKEENISFFVDSKEPRISVIKPVRGRVTNGSGFYIKYTEDNLKEVSVSWNPTQILTGCEAGKNKECSVNLNLSDYDGNYIDFWFNVSDYARSVQSKITRVMVDTTSPVLTVNLPNSTTYGRYVPFDVEVSEEIRLEYYDNSDLSPRWRMLCTRCEEYTKNKAFTRGNHDVLIRALDEAGNSDIEEVSFYVNY